MVYYYGSTSRRLNAATNISLLSATIGWHGMCKELFAPCTPRSQKMALSLGLVICIHMLKNLFKHLISSYSVIWDTFTDNSAYFYGAVVENEYQSEKLVS